MKKTLAVLAVVALICSLAIGNTLAYLQDSQADKNVMTVGKVTIEQYEKDRAGNDFVDNQKLLPMVDNRPAGESFIVGGFYNSNVANVIDKVITVKNTGTEAAYIRTIVLFETVLSYVPGSDTDINADLHYNYIGTLGDFDYISYEVEKFVKIGDVVYAVAVCVYENPVAAGATTEPSLKQFFLSPDAGNEFYDHFGSEYNILAISQAVQAQGFKENGTLSAAEVALNTAFGEVTAENVVSWFAEFGAGSVIEVNFIGTADNIVWPIG